ncbi:MAG: SDR family oxidoreductase [Candidatus Contendobacter sp.]|nr:SDR family oxidoreductase [Candidatus Contendobacter sp.]MDS4060712.1 SDR family oxidoreductase [Candidatus Contendobacter sp.]
MVENSQQLAVVTGANRGLGLETCRQLAQRGLRVMLTSRDEAEGQAAVNRLRGQGLAVRYRSLDVTDPASVAALADTLRREDGRIDALVNNAGVALEGFDAGVARRTLAVNFFGVMEVTDRLLPLLAPHGRIVMVSSAMGQMDGLPPALCDQFLNPALTRNDLVDLLNRFVRDVEAGRHLERGWPANAYRISKVGLNTFTRILARELAASTVRVNAVSPGWVRTAMGGPGAMRTVEEGASGIVWAALVRPDGPTGGFFRDGQPIPW